ncbi:MAG TPA: hypothetical protein VKA98_10385 [Nitrososphaeraceae archaeon]|nr:hypothetical protein [Nitrososphaeraceae archaeon]
MIPIIAYRWVFYSKIDLLSFDRLGPVIRIEKIPPLSPLPSP